MYGPLASVQLFVVWLGEGITHHQLQEREGFVIRRRDGEDRLRPAVCMC
jgi:hypothetical protein